MYIYIYIHTQPHTHTYCVYTPVLAYMTECAWIFRKEMAPPIPMLLKITSLGVYPIFRPTYYQQGYKQEIISLLNLLNGDEV